MTQNGNPSSALLPAFAVLCAIISLCVGASYARQLFDDVGAEGATTYRVAFAAVMLMLFWRPWRFALSKESAKAILKYGFVLGLMNLLFYMSIRTIPLGVAIAIEFIGPLAVSMYGSRRLIDFVWIAFAAIGLFLLLPLGGVQEPLDPVGLVFVFGAAICWAMYIIFGKEAGKGHAGQVTALGVMTASFVVLPFGIAKAGTTLLKPEFMLTGVLVAFLSSAIPYSLEMFALKRLPASTFGILQSMEPAVGAVAGLIILGQMLDPIQWIAIACIIAASVGTTMTAQAEPALADADGLT